VPHAAGSQLAFGQCREQCLDAIEALLLASALLVEAVEAGVHTVEAALDTVDALLMASASRIEAVETSVDPVETVFDTPQPFFDAGKADLGRTESGFERGKTGPQAVYNGRQRRHLVLQTFDKFAQQDLDCHGTIILHHKPSHQR
jgi:hypothetical protein